MCEAVEESSAWDRVKVKVIAALASGLIAFCLCACLVYVRLRRRRRHLKGIIRPTAERMPGAARVRPRPSSPDSGP